MNLIPSAGNCIRSLFVPFHSAIRFTLSSSYLASLFSSFLIFLSIFFLSTFLSISLLLWVSTSSLFYLSIFATARYLFIYFCLLYQFLEYQEEDEDTACWLLQRQVRTSLIRCYVKNETDAQILEAKEAKEALLKNSKVKTLEGTIDSHIA